MRSLCRRDPARICAWTAREAGGGSCAQGVYAPMTMNVGVKATACVQMHVKAHELVTQALRPSLPQLATPGRPKSKVLFASASEKPYSVHMAFLKDSFR